MAIAEGQKLAIELKAIINKYGAEAGLTLAEAVGLLEITKRDIIEEAIRNANNQLATEAKEKADGEASNEAKE